MRITVTQNCSKIIHIGRPIGIIGTDMCYGITIISNGFLQVYDLASVSIKICQHIAEAMEERGMHNSVYNMLQAIIEQLPGHFEILQPPLIMVAVEKALPSPPLGY